jgi:hypothetical protein
MLARASTKTFVSRIHIRQPIPKISEKNLRKPKNSLAGSLVSRGISIMFHRLIFVYEYWLASRQFFRAGSLRIFNPNDSLEVLCKSARCGVGDKEYPSWSKRLMFL